MVFLIQQRVLSRDVPSIIPLPSSDRTSGVRSRPRVTVGDKEGRWFIITIIYIYIYTHMIV